MFKKFHGATKCDGARLPWLIASGERRLGSRIPLPSLIQTLAVAGYLNFRDVANALGVSLSSASARVKTLDEDLGILLFERHARGRPTDKSGTREQRGLGL
ncbi:MAG: LysR family transcriptional regulator [Rhodospirillaceae bacterium]|nr:LysR family transcriptional regulator [Rhodospirillaceae bacterium]